MDISTKGLIEIMSHEGVCLSPYKDSVGVWTIGVGITKWDGVSPKDMGDITMPQAIDLFRARIGSYVRPVQALPLTLSQTQFDALVSFTFNCGPGNLTKLTTGRSVNAIGTALMASTAKLAARKQWMVDHLQLRGKVVVDAGAAIKLREEGKSLLPIGVQEVSGEFHRGDVIAIVDLAGQELARGLTNYGSAEARLIARKPSFDIERVLGYAAEPELIHRDNLVLR